MEKLFPNLYDKVEQTTSIRFLFICHSLIYPSIDRSIFPSTHPSIEWQCWVLRQFRMAVGWTCHRKRRPQTNENENEIEIEIEIERERKRWRRCLSFHRPRWSTSSVAAVYQLQQQKHAVVYCMSCMSAQNWKNKNKTKRKQNNIQKEKQIGQKSKSLRAILVNRRGRKPWRSAPTWIDGRPDKAKRNERTRSGRKIMTDSFI